MSDEKFVQVRLRRPILDEEGNETSGYEDYVCWIPLDLAKKAKEKKRPIKLYFDELDEWRDGFILEDFDGKDPISKERANGMYTRNQQFKRFKFAGRPSYKD